MLKISSWLIIIVLLTIIYFFKLANNYPSPQRTLTYPNGFFGVTFSKEFSTKLGLKWKEVYLAILDDLKVKEIRIPIYWDEIETTQGVFNFSDYDYIFKEGAKRNVKFIANIGWRLPRWPECHAPNWTRRDNVTETRAETLVMLDKVVRHYRHNKAIVAWQVENEPLLNSFGVCPPSNEAFLKQEIKLVRSLDSRPIIISATGELSSWGKEAKLADIFGSTVYRVVWGRQFGYIRYPIPAWFYRFKANLAGIPAGKRIIIELQAEPWVSSGSMVDLSKSEANKSFNIRQFKANLQYAININFRKTYLWGVEWWYWQYKNGDPSYWELARTLFN